MSCWPDRRPGALSQGLGGDVSLPAWHGVAERPRLWSEVVPGLLGQHIITCLRPRTASLCGANAIHPVKSAPGGVVWPLLPGQPDPVVFTTSDSQDWHLGGSSSTRSIHGFGTSKT